MSKLEPIHRISPKVNEQLEAHLALMGEMGASATPAIDYLDDDGRLHQQQQAAPRPDSLNQISAAVREASNHGQAGQCRFLKQQ